MVKTSGSLKTHQTLDVRPFWDYSSPRHDHPPSCPPRGGTGLMAPGPGGPESGLYLAIRGSSSNMVSSTLR